MAVLKWKIMAHLDISMLETWLWDAACAIRGATDAPKFKDFILPLVFFKRLSDVFEDEFAAHVKEYGDEDLARTITGAALSKNLCCQCIQASPALMGLVGRGTHPAASTDKRHVEIWNNAIPGKCRVAKIKGSKMEMARLHYVLFRPMTEE